MSYDDEIEENNSIQIIYRLNKNYNKMRIFGKNFVINNEKNCKIKYKDKEYKLN